jgi:hypothetical protein
LSKNNKPIPNNIFILSTLFYPVTPRAQKKPALRAGGAVAFSPCHYLAFEQVVTGAKDKTINHFMIYKK